MKIAGSALITMYTEKAHAWVCSDVNLWTSVPENLGKHDTMADKLV